MKKAIATNLAAMAAVLSLPMVAAAQTMPQLSAEGIDLYVSMRYSAAWDNSDVFPADSAGIYILPAGATAPVPVVAPVQVSGGMAYHDGKVYINTFDNGEGGEDGIVPEWRIYDLKSGELETRIPGEAGSSNLTSTLTYDATEDVVYGILTTNAGSFLTQIDPETGEKTVCGQLSELDGSETHRIDRCRAIAADKWGDIYAIYIRYPDASGTLRFGRIIKSGERAGTIVRIGEISPSNMLEGDYLQMAYNNQYALFYNNRDDKMYWISGQLSINIESSYYSPIFEMNLNSGAATMVGYLPQGYQITGAFFDEPVLDSPNGIDDLRYTYSPQSDDRTTGCLELTAPSTTYGGDEIVGSLTIVIKEGDTEVARIENVEPGANVATETQTFGYGEHSFSCYAIANGVESFSRDFDLWVGYDLPSNPTNALVTADGLTLNLTWDAPTTGMHGYEIDADNIYYRIYRYHDSQNVELLADYVETTSYQFEIPSELNRYLYIIYPCYNEQSGSGITTNTIIAGTPLEAPYSTDFSDVNEMANRYKILDSNADGHSWNWAGMAYYWYSEVNDADDWLFTPPINYKAGHRYRMTIMAQSSLSDYPERLELTFGNDDEVEAQELLLNIEEVAADVATEYSVEVTPEEDGVHFFGLHCTSPAYSEYLFLTALEIVDLDDPTVGIDEVGSPVANIEVVTGDGTITITNPEGNSIAIYTTGGTMVASSSATEFTTDAAQGVYIVKCGNSVQKVIVK